MEDLVIQSEPPCSLPASLALSADINIPIRIIRALRNPNRW
jgi:hypothetical protein